jgi:hypothetical protein
MSLQEYLLEKVKEQGLTPSEFEQFVLDSNFNDVQILNIDDDLNRFKVQANFWGSGVSYNKAEDRTGWKPFVIRYKKEKQAVKDFYCNHPKYVLK